MRVEHLNILPLPAPEDARFNQAWNALQGRFVDNPKGVLVEADQLVRELMLKRGYPMGDFERRAADLAAAAEIPIPQREVHPAPQELAIGNKDSTVNSEEGQLSPLFLADAAAVFRSRWDAVQIGFVDDPKQAVLQADEL